MTHCQLVRRERIHGALRGTVVALHAAGGDANALWPLCESLADFDAVAPQAPRARDPFHASAAPDDPRWRAYAGYSWFRSDERGRPEPASFGDSLSQLESLAHELAAGGPVFLIGHGAGATLARGAGLAFPEALAAVVALGGAWPVIPGWSESIAWSRWLPLLEDSDDGDPRGAADRIRVFLDARREGARDGRCRSQEADQDLLQAHLDR
jgi:predicted esterase